MENRIDAAITARESFVSSARKTPHPKTAFRLFDGFKEIEAGGETAPFVLDVFGSTLVVFDHRPREILEAQPGAARELAELVLKKLPLLRVAVHKPKHAPDAASRRGAVILGDEKDVCRAIEEDGVRYAIRLLVHHDASFYLETRSLRAFLKANAKAQSVLNAFAYTGSVGAAARSAPASRVVQTDKSKEFLTVAKDTYSLNGFPIDRSSFIAGDFFDVAAKLRKAEQVFSWVVLDPPLYAESAKGRVDVVSSIERLIDKARPLVGDGGRLIVVNNALFVSGAEFMKSLEGVVAQGYTTIETTIPVDADCAPPAAGGALPADPAPFNHPTKIAVLKMTRRDGRKPGRK